jgi:hypothetical protein
MKKSLSIVLAVLVFNLGLVGTAAAGTGGDAAAKRAEKVKAGIQKLGAGKDSHIEVTLADGTKLKGYVSEIKDTSFVVTSDATNAATEVPYPNAKKVQGNNLNTGVKIAIGVAIVVVVLLIIGFATRSA